MKTVVGNRIKKKTKHVMEEEKELCEATGQINSGWRRNNCFFMASIKIVKKTFKWNSERYLG